MTISMNTSIANHAGEIFIYNYGDKLEMVTKSSSSDSWRKVGIYINPEKATDLIELLTAYVEFRNNNPREEVKE